MLLKKSQGSFKWLRLIANSQRRRRADFAASLSAIYPELRRKEFAKIQNSDIAHFKEILDGRVITDEGDLAGFNTDWLRMFKGNGKIVLRPKSTVEVSKILSYCNDKNIAVVPQGGNTGLVGGGIPVFDEVIISMGLMNKIISLDRQAGILKCQSGCVLEALNKYLSDHGLIVPLDLGAKGSCHIGGNISTNAGGLRLLKYGSLHGNVLGLEAVLADGTVASSLSAPRKDNTGYDWKQLFIGAEGTLGVVTAVSILTPPAPKAVNVAFLAVDSFQQVQDTYAAARSMLGEVLSAFEFLDDWAVGAVIEQLGYPIPISRSPFYVLVETSGSNGVHDTEKLTSFLESVMADGTVRDGTVASDTAKVQSIWRVRESVASAMAKEGAVYKYDMSLPVHKLYQLTDDVRRRVGPQALRVVGYGHIGDGNLHLNVIAEKTSAEMEALLEPYIFEWTASCQGSVSAEHGLGFKKANTIHYSKSPAEIAIMKAIKQQLDPKGILNPYKTLPWRSVDG